ncbi:S8 family serine peptidase [Streptococcus merionis]
MENNSCSNKKRLMSLIAGMALLHAPQVLAQEQVDNVSQETMPDQATLVLQQDQQTTEVTNENTPVTSDKPEAEEPTSSPSENEAATEKAISIVDEVDPSHVKSMWEAGYDGKGTLVAVIDTELDGKHEMLQLDTTEDARFQSKEAMEKQKAEHGVTRGQWVNDKVVFYHDYSGSNAPSMLHGTHVTGILAGNSKQASAGSYLLQGIAPQAQVMFLKVGKDPKQSFVREIQDAMAMGANVINISLGSSAEAISQLDSSTLEILQKARKQGIAIVVAAGNDGAFGKEVYKPLAANPDYGLIGTPANTDDVFTVAAYATPRIGAVLEVKSEDKAHELLVPLSYPLQKDISYSLEYLSKGEQADYQQKEVKGKIVLVEQEGNLTLKQKIQLAQRQGAAGILVLSKPDQKTSVALPYVEDMVTGVPNAKDSQALKAMLQGKLFFTGKYSKKTDLVERYMDTFSSWGLTPEGNIKPDIAAPGHEIYSAMPNGQYATVSGTSMAAPHLSGVVTLLQQHVAKKFAHLSLSPEQRLALVKKILLSSANPLWNEETKAYYSPRQQGAGAVDAKKALAADMYLASENDEAKIHLKNVSDQFEIKVKVKNLSQQARTLTYQANVMTDKVEDGSFTLTSRALLSTTPQKLVIEANSEKTISIPVDTSRFTKELLEQMKNGYFLDGFVRFHEVGGQQDLLSIPFIGFHGDYTNLPALESSIYQSADGQTFYRRPQSKETAHEFPVDDFKELKEEDFTGLKTTFTPWSVVEHVKSGGYAEESMESSPNALLGSYEKVGDDTVRLLRFKDGKPYLLLSPNGDDNMDAITLQGLFLRNVKDLKASVYDAKDMSKPIWESEHATQFIRKNFAPHVGVKETTYESTKWDGKDATGNFVPNGTYIYRVTYTPLSTGAKEQFTDFTIKVHVTPPQLPAAAKFDESKRLVELAAEKQSSDVEIYRKRLVYTYKIADEENGTMTSATYFDSNDKGQFILPAQFENTVTGEMEDLTPEIINQLTYVVEDMAGNYSAIPLKELLSRPMPKEEPEEMKPENPKQQDNGHSTEPKKEQEQDQSSKQLPPLFKPHQPLPKMDTMTKKSDKNSSQPRDTMPDSSESVPKEAMAMTNPEAGKVLPQTNSTSNHSWLIGIFTLISTCFFWKKRSKQ